MDPNNPESESAQPTNTDTITMPAHPSSKNSNNLAVLLLLVLVAVGIVLYLKPNLTSPTQSQPPFTPLPFLTDCGFTKDFKNVANSNPFVVDARLSGSLKGTVQTVSDDAIQLTATGSTETLKIPLLGKNGKMPTSEKIVYSPTTTAASAVSTLKSGQVVTVAFLCRPKVAKFQFLSPSFEVLSILVNK